MLDAVKKIYDIVYDVFLHISAFYYLYRYKIFLISYWKFYNGNNFIYKQHRNFLFPEYT
jgi:hypothetical protein